MPSKPTIDFTTFPVLTTERLILREFRRSDAADVLIFRGDPIVQKYDDPVIHTREEALTFIAELHEEYLAQKGVSWAVTLSEQDVVLGYWRTPNLLPGRLYFDHLMVPIRSEMEAKLIALIQVSEILPVEPPELEKNKSSTRDGPVVVVGDDLKEYYAKMSEGMEEVIQHLIENLINFVQSREYVRIAKKFETKVNRN
jgi:hypothetical protein